MVQPVEECNGLTDFLQTHKCLWGSDISKVNRYAFHISLRLSLLIYDLAKYEHMKLHLIFYFDCSPCDLVFLLRYLIRPSKVGNVLAPQERNGKKAFVEFYSYILTFLLPHQPNKESRKGERAR